MKRLLIVFLILSLFWPLWSRAAVLKSNYPRLANYFLKWSLTDQEAQELSKWDLLILDMEVQVNSPAQLKRIRALNPNVIILAYITPEEILDDISSYNQASLRQTFASQLISGWYLHDTSGNRISNWPYTHLFNITDQAPPDSLGRRLNDYIPAFVAEKIYGSGLWDGVFYDNAWGDISWLNNGNLDFDDDGQAATAKEADALWSAGFKKIFSKTRELTGGQFIIVGNAHVYEGYQSLLNGMMLESFPSSWESGGHWLGSMETYWRLPTLNLSPTLSVLNVGDKNQFNYVHFRFGLASALLGDGYYSFDYDVTNHGQTRWYDEYNVNLGPAQSRAYNLSAGNSFTPALGLWRRDFKNGVAIVNSSAEEQTYVFDKEQLEKIKGDQDPGTNNGQRINYLKLAPQDGVVLLKRNTLITDVPFTNGYFYRVFNAAGEQVQTGFFSYLNGYPGEAELLFTESVNQEQITLTADKGQAGIYNNSQPQSVFKPFNNLYKGRMSLAAQVIGGQIQKILIGAGPGGGPQVRLFNASGRVLASFFAYDKNSRGGVNAALGDVNGDGQLEIVTGPGPSPSLTPLVKIFSLTGKELGSFSAYDQNFKGGVTIALGDVDGDGRAEIITSPGSGGGPQIRIFNAAGQVLDDWFAYDKSYHGGIKVTAADLNQDGRAEILVGLKNFY